MNNHLRDKGITGACDVIDNPQAFHPDTVLAACFMIAHYDGLHTFSPWYWRATVRNAAAMVPALYRRFER